MRLSIIIPCLNEERFIGNCIDSVMLHKPENHEIQIIVVDASSTDSTVQIAQSRGVLVVGVPKSTIAAQRNVGARLAQGDILAFVDADCTVTAGWASSGLEIFFDNRVVGAGAPPIAPEVDCSWVQRTWAYLKRKPKSTRSIASWIPSANLWVRAQAFREIGGFDENFETCEDADLGYRLSRLGQMIVDPNVCVVHHREPATLLDFFRKELWHGKHSFEGAARGRWSLAELPSLIAPIYFAIFSAITVVGIVGFGFFGANLVLVGMCGMTLLPMAYTLRALASKGEYFRVIQCFTLYYVYFGARAVALIRWIIFP